MGEKFRLPLLFRSFSCQSANGRKVRMLIMEKKDQEFYIFAILTHLTSYDISELTSLVGGVHSSSSYGTRRRPSVIASPHRRASRRSARL